MRVVKYKEKLIDKIYTMAIKIQLVRFRWTTLYQVLICLPNNLDEATICE